VRKVASIELDPNRYRRCVYPEKRICTICGKPFETTVECQMECVSCLSKPHRNIIESEQKEKTNMERIFKERNCGCGKSFMPTSPSQKRCPDCMAAGKQYTVPKTEPPESPPVPTEGPAPKVDMHISEMIRAVMDQIGATSVTFIITR